jgi:pyridoxine/pyridoxamine 5'-phosphate oxidase
MSRKLSREDAHSEQLLELAGHWRKYAADETHTDYKAMMLRTAEEFERAAARATSQASP